MMFSWNGNYRCLTIVYGEDWERGDFKPFSFRKTPLGWDMNVWRLSISYDDLERVKS
jgi:hypothetical protein